MDNQNNASITQAVCQLFQQQLIEHPFDAENTNLRSVLDLLYTAYTETQIDDPEPVKQAFRHLDECMKDVSLDTNNEVFSIVCQIYCAGEERAFLDGVRIGAHLVKELYSG